LSNTQTPAEALHELESRNATLGARLAAHREKSARLRPDIAKAYDDLVTRLGILDSGQVGPQVGERMPQFNLPSHTGELISLRGMLQSGPAVICINRGHWCPYCKLELRSLAAINSDIERLGARVVSIMPDTAAFTADYTRENALPFPILSDIALGYSLLLGLIFWVGPEVQRLYEAAGVDLERYQGNDAAFLPMAAKFIVRPDGMIAARQVNIEFRERMEPETVLSELRKLRGDASIGQRNREVGQGKRDGA
jgi:peroxiredoxin